MEISIIEEAQKYEIHQLNTNGTIKRKILFGHIGTDIIKDKSINYTISKQSIHIDDSIRIIKKKLD